MQKILPGFGMGGSSFTSESFKSAFWPAAAFAASPWYGLALVLLFCTGFLELSFNSMAQTLVQMEAPAHMRGRVIGLYAMSSQGLRAFAGVTVGLLGSLIGIHWSLALSALMLLTVVAILMAFTVRTK